ncbi:MAG TPA: PEGA domain-containing protein [Candidatus Saccharimonadales bacterium]|nr:PEGA domain-containing protein [Candidatus Saccharimonadales bacterium]
MDFLNPKKKRAHLIRLYIGYALMAVALIAGTLILVFSAYGYDIDHKTGGIIQNGLVILDAHPEAASIIVNGVNKGTTSNRLVIPAGQYSVELQSNGYRTWKHTFNLEGSSIEQLVYPFLFPSKLATKSVQDYAAAPAFASESSDRHWLIIQVPGSDNNFSTVDLTTAKHPTTAFSLPLDALTSTPGTSSFEPVEWAGDNVHLLLKHVFAGGTEFIMLDRENPENSLNLNRIFATQPITSISLRDNKADQLYLFNAADGHLLQADSKSGAATLLLQHVLTYKSYQSNTVVYTTNPTSSPTDVEVHVHQDTQDYLLRTLPAASDYLLDIDSFSGHLYLASGSRANGRTYLYKDPFSDFNHHPARTPQPFRVLIVAGAQYISFSLNTRFVAVQGSSSFAVYDAETDRQFRYDTKLPLEPNQKAVWMDGHRLTLMSGGIVNVFDFDGTNLQPLSPGLAGLTPFFDHDYTAMLTLAASSGAADKVSLTRTELKVLPPGTAQ